MSERVNVPSESELAAAKESLGGLSHALNEAIFGQEALVELVLAGVLAGGHLLLEGLPGLGKTELVKSLSKALGLKAGRIQFTPDLLPGDITGNPMLQEIEGTRKFVFQKGPLFANLVLADEINRASPKTQSALLEAMQERRVTVMGESHGLPEPFFVLATQNPIELEGTYPLPEAQLDRFLFKLQVLRNEVEVLEKIVLNREMGAEVVVPQVMSAEKFGEVLKVCRRIYFPPAVASYVARLVDGTHPGRSQASRGVRYGASPRAALGLAAAVKALALLGGRMNAGFEDVRRVAAPVLRHRIVLDYAAKLDGRTTDDVVRELLEEIPAQEKDLPRSLSAAKL